MSNFNLVFYRVDGGPMRIKTSNPHQIQERIHRYSLQDNFTAYVLWQREEHGWSKTTYEKIDGKWQFRNGKMLPPDS